MYSCFLIFSHHHISPRNSLAAKLRCLFSGWGSETKLVAVRIFRSTRPTWHFRPAQCSSSPGVPMTMEEHHSSPRFIVKQAWSRTCLPQEQWFTMTCAYVYTVKPMGLMSKNGIVVKQLNINTNNHIPFRMFPACGCGSKPRVILANLPELNPPHTKQPAREFDQTDNPADLGAGSWRTLFFISCDLRSYFLTLLAH